MRRHRRLVLTDRIIPFLAAFVGLLALAGAVIVEIGAEQRAAQLSGELARLRLAMDLLSQRTEILAGAADDGTADGLLALQDRMARLEQEWQSQPAPSVAAAPPEAAAEAVAAVPATAAAAPAEVDPDLPTADCIPQGTRFMGVTGESYAICQTPAVVRVSAITGDNVVVEGAGVITETGFANLAGTTCTLMVFSADVEGFAEMRVSCQ